MSILTALGAGGGGGGGEEGGSGEGGARDLGTTAEGEEGGKKEDLPAAVSLNSSANGIYRPLAFYFSSLACLPIMTRVSIT